MLIKNALRRYRIIEPKTNGVMGGFGFFLLFFEMLGSSTKPKFNYYQSPNSKYRLLTALEANHNELLPEV